jgi:hypothetical protein
MSPTRTTTSGGDATRARKAPSAAHSGLDPKPGKNTQLQSQLFRRTISDKNFKEWAKSFEADVAEVLLYADTGEWGQNPARDCYERFGWRREMPSRHIAGWWQWSIREFERDGPEESLPSYRAAFDAIMAIL